MVRSNKQTHRISSECYLLVFYLDRMVFFGPAALSSPRPVVWLWKRESQLYWSIYTHHGPRQWGTCAYTSVSVCGAVCVWILENGIVFYKNGVFSEKKSVGAGVFLHIRLGHLFHRLWSLVRLARPQPVQPDWSGAQMDTGWHTNWTSDADAVVADSCVVVEALVTHDGIFHPSSTVAMAPSGRLGRELM